MKPDAAEATPATKPKALAAAVERLLEGN